MDEWAEDSADPAVRAIARRARKVTRKVDSTDIRPAGTCTDFAEHPKKANDAIDAPADQGGAVVLPGGNAG